MNRNKNCAMLDTLSDREKVFRSCISYYGADSQVDMAIEEMSELTKALLKLRRAKQGEAEAARIAIIDELADVRIMVRQMEILFQCRSDVEERIDYKVRRQKRRLESALHPGERSVK